MKKIILFFIFIYSISLNTQVPSDNLSPLKFYSFAKISLNDMKKFDCKNLTITLDSISFMSVKRKEDIKFALANIDYIRVREGNHALEWGGFGALVMGLIALSAIVDDLEFNDNTVPVFLAFTFTGGAIGGLVGLASPRWKTYYLNY
jgi:hypothetical protein